MRLEIPKGNYFVFNEMSNVYIYKLQEWLYRNGFEANIESRQLYTIQQPRPYFYMEDPYNPYSNPYNNPHYIESRQEVGCLLNYRYIRAYYNDTYKTDLIKIGMCIISSGSRLFFLDPGEYEILPTGLKILPNE